VTIPVDWLPKEAFQAEAVGAVFAPSVEAWSQNWFARGTAIVCGVRTSDEASARPSVQRLQGNVVAVELHPRGKRLLLEMALGVDPAEQQLLDADRRILDAFETDVAEDLVKRLDKEMNGGGAYKGGVQSEVTVSVVEDEMLTIICPQHILVPHLKKRLGPSSPAARALESRMKALRPARVVADGILGHAQLSIDELEELSVGDVLVLDRTLNDLAELRLSNSGKLIGSGKLLHGNGKTSIQL
jgi:flagellar motor switch/type III secretory pathway protein FliN